tara:strand:- start:14485 stop:15516 length:1032 start_codon:yes stop_codon:yes gene_type:complete
LAEADPSIFAAMPAVEERQVADPAALDALLESATAPFVVRGIARDWPLVQAGLRSAREAREYVVHHAHNRPFPVTLGPPGHDGRLFYTDTMEMNFQTARGKLADIFKGFDDNEGRAHPPAIYLTSIDLNEYFDGLHEANHVPLGTRQPINSIWIGTATRVAAHNDFPDNLAVCAVGRRRFTIFPPEQFRNLYLGPIDNTPAGRAVSMVDFHAPDWDAHPRFKEALKHGQVAELEPGDAVFVPSMWWHHVEGLDPFNILVNYWWRDTPRWLGQPQDALHHAILSIRDLPEKDRKIWRDLFDYYVFNHDESVTAHIPEGGRGVLDPITPEGAGRLRAFLLRALNR